MEIKNIHGSKLMNAALQFASALEKQGIGLGDTVSILSD